MLSCAANDVGVKAGHRRRPQVVGLKPDLNLLPAQMVKPELEQSGNGYHYRNGEWVFSTRVCNRKPGEIHGTETRR